MDERTRESSDTPAGVSERIRTWSQPRVPLPLMRKGCASLLRRTSLDERESDEMMRLDQRVGATATRMHGDGPNHADALAEDGRKVRGDVGHGGVGIGVEHLVGDLDGAGDAAHGEGESQAHQRVWEKQSERGLTRGVWNGGSTR